MKTDTKVVGNVGAMRDALKLCIANMCGYCRIAAALQGDAAPCLNGCETLRIAKAALAAPPRQCDVGTAEEQNERYKLYCAYHRDAEGGPGAYCMKCPLNDRKNSLVMCQFLWAQMSYEANEKEAKHE